MIVDCHVNIWEDRHVLPLWREQMQRVRPGGVPPKADAKTLAKAMSGVDKAIIFALRYGDSAGIESDDETTAAAVKAYPKKFVGFAYVDPRRKDYMELLRHAVEDLGLKGVKYGPIYNGVPLGDKRMAPVYDYCVKHDLPLTMHMGTTFAVNAPVELGRAIHVDPIAERWPDLKMILAHMGHPWYEECIVVIRKRPNVYAEVSALFYRPWQYWNILVTGRSCGSTGAMSRPPSRMRPSSGVSKPASILSSVVLPQPLGPSSAKNSPAPISSDSRSTARKPQNSC